MALATDVSYTVGECLLSIVLRRRLYNITSSWIEGWYKKNDEFETIWKRTAVGWLEVLSRSFPGGLKKTIYTLVGVAGVPTENRKQNLLNKSLILCHGTEANGIDCSFVGTCHRFLFARRKHKPPIAVEITMK